jgi:hypothetical protein
MKQRITLEQLNELTDEQKGRLREWWNPQRGDFALVWKVGRDGIPYDQKDIVIGGSTSWDKGNGQYFTYDAPETFDNDGSCDYYRKDCMFPLLSIGQMLDIMHARNTEFGNHYIDFDWEGELADALWNEVKEALK